MKTCTYKACTNPQFGGQMCRIHQWARKDKNIIRKINKRTKRVSVKKPDFGYDSLIALFKDVYWEHSKPIKCIVSGVDLTGCISAPVGVFVSHFAHILPRSHYSFWKYNKRNILILSPYVHHLFDQGTQEQRDKHPDWNWGALYAEVEQAKDDYAEWVNENNL